MVAANFTLAGLGNHSPDTAQGVLCGETRGLIFVTRSASMSRTEQITSVYLGVPSKPSHGRWLPADRKDTKEPGAMGAATLHGASAFRRSAP